MDAQDEKLPLPVAADGVPGYVLAWCRRFPDSDHDWVELAKFATPRGCKFGVVFDAFEALVADGKLQKVQHGLRYRYRRHRLQAGNRAALVAYLANDRTGQFGSTWGGKRRGADRPVALARRAEADLGVMVNINGGRPSGVYTHAVPGRDEPTADGYPWTRTPTWRAVFKLLLKLDDERAAAGVVDP